MNYGMLLICWHMLRCCTSPYARSRGHFDVAHEASQIRSQIRELTCEAWHVYIRRGFGANDEIFLGMDLWSISTLYIILRVDTCMEHFNICCMHF